MRQVIHVKGTRKSAQNRFFPTKSSLNRRKFTDITLSFACSFSACFVCGSVFVALAVSVQRTRHTYALFRLIRALHRAFISFSLLFTRGITVCLSFSRALVTHVCAKYTNRLLAFSIKKNFFCLLCFTVCSPVFADFNLPMFNRKGDSIA